MVRCLWKDSVKNKEKNMSTWLKAMAVVLAAVAVAAVALNNIARYIKISTM